MAKQYPASEGYIITSEALLRDAAGRKAIDPVTGSGRRIDFVVDKNGNIVDSIEVTSKTSDKVEQTEKEKRIRAGGGNYVKTERGSLVRLPDDLSTRIDRRD